MQGELQYLQAQQRLQQQQQQQQQEQEQEQCEVHPTLDSVNHKSSERGRETSSPGRRIGRRPILQKSITVDHSGNSGRAALLFNRNHRANTRTQNHQQTEGQVDCNNETFANATDNVDCVEESNERSRMRRAIRKLETALKMRSLDHS